MDNEQMAGVEYLRLLSLADVDTRRRALDRLLADWDRILADECGERMGDYFARLATLDQALDELDARLEEQLVPTTPTH